MGGRGGVKPMGATPLNRLRRWAIQITRIFIVLLNDISPTGAKYLLLNGRFCLIHRIRTMEVT